MQDDAAEAAAEAAAAAACTHATASAAWGQNQAAACNAVHCNAVYETHKAQLGVQ